MSHWWEEDPDFWVVAIGRASCFQSWNEELKGRRRIRDTLAEQGARIFWEKRKESVNGNKMSQVLVMVGRGDGLC